MTSRPGGAPFVNRLPQSVIDRFEEQKKEATKRVAESFDLPEDVLGTDDPDQ